MEKKLCLIITAFHTRVMVRYGYTLLLMASRSEASALLENSSD